VKKKEEIGGIRRARLFFSHVMSNSAISSRFSNQKLPAASAQAALWVLILLRVMFLALCVIVGLKVRTTLGTW
jgi:hypothetical protein